jgi:hypothetical protein
VSRRADITKARRLYRGFREEDVASARAGSLSVPRAVAQIGIVEFIGYTTTHGGRVRTYLHEFAAGSRPHLYAGTGRGQLFIVGGRFKVTPLGITDLSPTGKVVHGKSRYLKKLGR